MLSISTFAQTDVREKVPVFTQDPKANFRLYPTQNMYNFIELDTRTGQMRIVQWSTSGNQLSTVLSNEKRVYDTKDEIPGRFTLYATTNFYNFILLDQIDGRRWQVQWSTKPEERMVLFIMDY